MKSAICREDKHLFPPFGDELIGTLLYLFGGQRSATPVDSFAVRVDAINVQRFSGAVSWGTQIYRKGIAASHSTL